MQQSLIITGTTGMVGQSVLLASLDQPEVGRVLSLSRRPTGLPAHPKLTERIVPDFYDLLDLAAELGGYDACLHCLGVSVIGMSEEAYTRVTHDLTLHLAQTYLAANPQGGFCYVSGGGTDVDSRQMWARVKGRTENELLAMPFKHVHAMRLGFLEPMPGVRSSTKLYQALYVVLRPLFLVLRSFPGVATNAYRLAKAMRRAALEGYAKPVLESRDINALGA